MHAIICGIFQDPIKKLQGVEHMMLWHSAKGGYMFGLLELE